MRARFAVGSTVLVLAMTLTSCGSDTGDGPDGAPAVDGQNAPDGSGAGAGLRGVLIGPDEQPLLDVQVLACQATTCLFGDSGSDGRFEFAVVPPANVALKTHTVLAQNPRLAAALEPVAVVDDTLVDVGTVYVPDLPAGSVIGPETEDPQTLQAGDELELTVNRADLTAPLGEFLFDVAARRLPEQHIPPYPELGGEQVVAVYAMHPFGGTSASPIGVRAPADLPDGTSVKFRTISEIDGTFSEPVTGQVDAGYAATGPGVGITRITYLVITR